MGAWVSRISGIELEGEKKGVGIGLGDLPESCVAAVLMYLEPAEICQVARVDRAFRRASSTDFVWETKLPRTYEYLMEVGSEGIGEIDKRESLCKKEIYARLCRPNSFSGGVKEFWLEKTTGQICMSISSKGLAITGIDDRRYWSCIPTKESRFDTVAYLQQTWWLEVNGEINFCFPAGSYSLYFRLHLGQASKRLGRRIVNTEHVHGWDKKPVQFQLWTSDGQHAQTQCHLDDPGTWILYHAGDFVIRNSDAPTKLKFSMTQIDCTHTKGGLCIDSVYIYPKTYLKR